MGASGRGVGLGALGETRTQPGSLVSLWPGPESPLVSVTRCPSGWGRVPV